MSPGPTPAVLLLVFNRPEQTRLAVQALLRERPARLYVSGDGPRAGVASDAALVAEVWDVVRAVPWECTVHELRLGENLGCAGAVRAGIDWFLKHEARGLIVEDDVELGPGALALAEQLLEAGDADPRVGSVTVFNTVPSARLADPDAHYRRSIYCASQGWGTWARTWGSVPRTPVGWHAWLTPAQLRRVGGRDFAWRWRQILDADAEASLHTWDFTWQAYLWSRGLVTLVANANHVRNTGFTDTATFSASQPHWWPTTVDAWVPPCRHPRNDEIDNGADHWESRHRYDISLVHTMRTAVARRVPRLAKAYRRRRYGG